MVTTMARSCVDIFEESILVNPCLNTGSFRSKVHLSGSIGWARRRWRATRSAGKLFAPLKSLSRARASVSTSRRDESGTLRSERDWFGPYSRGREALRI